MKNTSLVIAAVLLSICSWPGRLIAAEGTEAEPTREQRIYYFEHRLLPKWTYGTQGAFYEDLEKSEDIMENGTKTALCGWSEDGAHQNFGPRKYLDEASFVAERSAKSKKEPNQPPEPISSTSPQPAPTVVTPPVAGSQTERPEAR